MRILETKDTFVFKKIFGTEENKEIIESPRLLFDSSEMNTERRANDFCNERDEFFNAEDALLKLEVMNFSAQERETYDVHLECVEAENKEMQRIQSFIANLKYVQYINFIARKETDI